MMKISNLLLQCSLPFLQDLNYHYRYTSESDPRSYDHLHLDSLSAVHSQLSLSYTLHVTTGAFKHIRSLMN